jgi:hypothetical protein
LFPFFNLSQSPPVLAPNCPDGGPSAGYQARFEALFHRASSFKKWETVAQKTGQKRPKTYLFGFQILEPRARGTAVKRNADVM